LKATAELLAGDAATISGKATVGSVEDSRAKNYPMKDVTLSLNAERGGDGVIEILDFKLENPAGGTSLQLQGGAALAEQPQKLSLKGELHQDVAKVWANAASYAGAGALGLSFSVESSDLGVFRTVSELTLSGVHLKLPERGIVVDGLDGRVPIAVTLERGPHGVKMPRGPRANPYAALRFADQHSLLTHSSFLSLHGLTTPRVSIDSLAGNLEIQQNVISIDQMDLGIRGGRITGQCILDYDGERSTVQANVRATGVRSSYGEPFDGNAALLFSVHDRSLDGHADILRIGRRHLLDLVDLQDPDRTNASYNRIRQALAIGYPDHLHLSFNHGFASAQISFGGVARLVKLEELRGIPIEPMIDKALAKSAVPEENP
jgi:hypothetical protein